MSKVLKLILVFKSLLQKFLGGYITFQRRKVVFGGIAIAKLYALIRQSGFCIEITAELHDFLDYVNLSEGLHDFELSYVVHEGVIVQSILLCNLLNVRCLLLLERSIFLQGTFLLLSNILKELKLIVNRITLVMLLSLGLLS